MRIYLNQDWLLTYEDISVKAECLQEVSNKNEGWLKTDVPCDIRQPLITNRIINEPLEGMNCFDSEWIENKSWWFKKEFVIDDSFLDADVIELNMTSLDYGADIFLNGSIIGKHISAFYPFYKDVKKYLKTGLNIIVVRLTTGLETVDIDDMNRYVMSSEEDRRPKRGDKRKGFLRKPQYSFGWDWNPRVATCGIMGDVWMESHKKAVIRRVRTYVKSLSPEVILGFEIETENFHPFSTIDAIIELSMGIDNECFIITKSDTILKSGISYIILEAPVKNARLWWPNGMGEQSLYDIKVSMKVNDMKIDYPSFKYGIRTVNMDTSYLPNNEKLFALVINGVKVFCKGANWVPADSLYGRISDKKYETLVLEAKEANFNMLRIWGGGLYERDIFYDLCDKYGIMLWHDFMFACSEYPDDQAWFLSEVEKEADYQTKRLCNRPSIVLWCGNNENHWGFDQWWQNTGYHGSKFYNYVAPKAVHANCPDIPYWNSSPYGGEHPNGSDRGDRHHWNDCMMSENMQKRIVPEEYDKVTAKFVSEYGYIGPVVKSSVEKYLAGAPFDVDSDIWQHHTNTFEKDTVVAGIRYHYINPESLSMDEYLLYAGLCQGLIYNYSIEALRYKEYCHGCLFWMYNDSWGETGWSIIDYYMNRKISYYFVKRAFAHVKYILRSDTQIINVIGLNDTGVNIKQELEYGYISFDGTFGDSKTQSVELPAYSRNILLKFYKKNYDQTKGVWYVRSNYDDNISPAVLRSGTYRELELPYADIKIKDCLLSGENLHITVYSNNYAHGVRFNLPDYFKLSDNYFDLLPGESKKIVLYNVPEDLDISKIIPKAVNSIQNNCKYT